MKFGVNRETIRKAGGRVKKMSDLAAEECSCPDRICALQTELRARPDQSCAFPPTFPSGANCESVPSKRKLLRVNKNRLQPVGAQFCAHRMQIAMR